MTKDRAAMLAYGACYALYGHPTKPSLSAAWPQLGREQHRLWHAVIDQLITVGLIDKSKISD